MKTAEHLDVERTSRGSSVPIKMLAGARHMMLIAVLGSLGIAAVLLLFGAGLVGYTAVQLVTGHSGLSASTGKELSLVAIETIDLFLVATVAYVTAVGLYKLFIGGEVPVSLQLGIDNLDQLKQKIVGVLVVALGVLFLGAAMNQGDGPALLYLGVSTSMVIAALAYFVRHQDHSV